MPGVDVDDVRGERLVHHDVNAKFVEGVLR